MMSETKNNFLKRYSLISILLIICTILGMDYVNRSARNLVFMDFWRCIGDLIPKVMENKLTFGDLWTGAFGQRNFLQMALLSFDIKFLNLNCLWESYAGILFITASCISLFLVWNRIVIKISGNKNVLVYQIIFIPIIFSRFNFNQWEILSLQFSLAFMIRVFLYILLFAILDRMITSKIDSYTRYFAVGVGCAIVICFMSQLYFLALIAAIAGTFFFTMIIDREMFILKLKLYCSFLFPCVVGCIFYFWNMPSGSTGLSNSILQETIFSGKLILGYCYMLLGSIVPIVVLQNMDEMQFILGGIVLIVIIFISVIIYLKQQYYRDTLLPVFLILYGMASIGSITLGRSSKADMFYLTASRYTCETSLIWTGVILIFSLYFVKNLNLVKKGFSICTLLMISLLFLNVYFTEYHISVYRGAGKDALIDMLRNDDISMLSDEDLNGFQSKPDLVVKGIEEMKKYHLNIYK